MVVKGKFRELVELSKEGIACEQCNLGVAYALGDDTSKNIEKDNNNLSGKENYTFPLLALLNQPETAERDQATEEIKEQSAKLMQTLSVFKANAKIVCVSRGPSVTRFELEPAPGVKVSSVVELAEDIALRLAVPDVRVEAPVPGRAAVALEVPNLKRNPVSLLEMVRCDEVRNNPSILCVGLGRNTEGKVVTIDLAGMQHLLVAGMHASDTAAFIDSLLTGIFYKARPDEVKLVIADNRAERFTRYNSVPHLLGPVITDTKESVSALHWAVKEMKNRCRIFSERHVSNVGDYNAATADKLPDIVIIVSELCCLMAEAKAEVEEVVYSLSRKAPACGIHMVLATQNPSADVITDIVRMSIPSRIAFAVSDPDESRAVLRRSGAEQLLGKGDMLYYPADAINPLRVQGVSVSEQELNRVIESIRVKDLSVKCEDETGGSALSGESRKETEDTVLTGEDTTENDGFDVQKDAPPPKIKIVGVGCGGISCINRMVACDVQGVEYIAVDCDAQVLRSSVVQNRIQIGKQLTEGLGAGSRPEVGWIAAEKSRDALLEQLSGADIVFVVAGMGGGAGSGAAPVVAECARETGALTVGFVARPFHFEGRHRMNQADCAIEKMKTHVDALITVPNDRLLQTAETGEETPVLFHSAFADALRLGIQGISDIIAVPGLINADVDDVKMLLAGTGTVSMGIGTARGDDAAAEAAKMAVRDVPVKGTGGILFNITGGNNLSLYDAAGASDIVIEDVDPDVSVAFGVIIDDKMEDDEVRVSCYFIPGASC